MWGPVTVGSTCSECGELWNWHHGGIRCRTLEERRPELFERRGKGTKGTRMFTMGERSGRMNKAGK